MANCYCCKQSCNVLVPDPRKLRYDQDSFIGRYMELFQLTNPKYLFYLPGSYKTARQIINTIEVDGYRPCKTSDSEIWNAKSTYDSVYGKTGRKVPVLARPVYYAPFKTLLFFGMIRFNRDPKHIVLMQVLNQAFNINVVRHQRNPPAQPTAAQLLAAFLVGSVTSSATAVYLRNYLKKQCASRMALGMVPFVAVAAAHLLSTPFLRAQEMFEGKPIFDCCGTKLGVSRNVSHKSTSLDVICNICKVAPPLLLTPYVMKRMRLNGTFCRYPWTRIGGPVACIFLSLVLLSPLVGAIFHQRRSIGFMRLENNLKCKASKEVYFGRPPQYVCYCAGPPLPF
ncbi:unnamed protein product [Phyllotreta striolata]|uniref:Sidoreflexin n=1 Tax=Phyllotreta striolata TaxID=444603 RepID=A0A9N9TWU3_PHYSR|nr:unnamed protein product [Phyllotreta striolata]